MSHCQCQHLVAQGLRMLTHMLCVDVKGGPPIDLCANVLPQITGAIQCGPLLHWIFFDQLADGEKGSTFTIDLLVGSDYL